MNKPKVQRAAVGETERELEAEAMKTGDVEIVGRSDVPLHFQVRRHRFAIVREMLVHVKMVMDPPNASTLFK
jgi:hypothetical protein